MSRFFLGSRNGAAPAEEPIIHRLLTSTSFVPSTCNLAVPLHVPKAVSDKSPLRMRVTPISHVSTPFRSAKRLLTYSPVCAHAGKRPCRLGTVWRGRVPEPQLPPTTNCPSLSRWNFLVCWPSGCRKKWSRVFSVASITKGNGPQGSLKAMSSGAQDPLWGFWALPLARKTILGQRANLSWRGGGHPRLISGMIWLCLLAP